MARMRLAPRLKMSMSTAMRMQMAHTLEMPEDQAEAQVRAIEADPLFKRLAATGVLAVSEFPAARFSARRFAGYGLMVSGSGLPELVDGNCDLARLMQDIGQDRFQEWFLGDKSFSDTERAQGCGITTDEARRLRELLDRAFIRGEFEASAPAPEKVFSTVAGISIENGKPVVAFFHREIWKRSYRVNKNRLTEFLAGMSDAEAGKARRLLSSLELMERRKTTLYRLLEAVLATQAEYLRTGDPARRKPLTQRSVASRLAADPSVVNRLISNKSVQMPWGLEAPLEVFFPSAKDVNLGRLYELVRENPKWRDDDLRREMERRHGVRLSRPSIVQYRSKLAVGSKHPCKTHVAARETRQ